MKILFITYGFLKHGGIAGYTARLAEYFLKREQEVHLLTRYCKYKPSNLIVHKSFSKKFLELMPLWLTMSPRSPLRIFPWLQELLDTYDNTRFVEHKESEFDIVHSNSTYSWKCDIVAMHNCQKVWIKIADGILKKNSSYLKYLLYKYGKRLPNKITLAIERKVLEKGSKKIIAVSEGIKREISENYNVPEEKIVVIPPGVDLNEFEPNAKMKSKIRKELSVNQDTCVLMFSGGLDLERKGLEYLIRALSSVEGKIKLLITGKGDFQSYKQLANSLNVLDKIIFTGFVPEIKNYYAASDIFVFSSFYEAFPGVILEAAASGLPILTTKVNGAEEVITDGVNGFFIKRNPEDIANKISLLIGDKNLRKQMGENAYKTAQKYSWEETARKTLEVYKKVLIIKDNMEKPIYGNPIPLGDKGIPGERDDIFNPQITARVDTYKHLQRYRCAAKRIGNNRKVLDIGCGTGYGTKILSNGGKNEIYGIDNSQKVIDYAKKTYPGSKYTCCSAEKLPFEDNYFDAITTFEVIEHVQNPEKVLDEIYRVLKKDGDLFISTLNLRHLGNILGHFLIGRPYPEHSKNIYHLKEFYYNEFANFLKNAEFKIIFQYGQELRVWPWKVQLILEKILPFLIIYKLQTLSGYYFPKYATTVVLHVKK